MTRRASISIYSPEVSNQFWRQLFASAPLLASGDILGLGKLRGTLHYKPHAIATHTIARDTDFVRGQRELEFAVYYQPLVGDERKVATGVAKTDENALIATPYCRPALCDLAGPTRFIADTIKRPELITWSVASDAGGTSWG